MLPIALALLLPALASASAAPAAPLFTKLLLSDAVSSGAVCLDGSPVPLYVRPGSGADAANMIVFFEGGGWCESDEDCAGRAGTALGSSKFTISTMNSRDLLSPNCTANPYFCNWSFAYAAYVDGASRSGDAAEPVTVGGTTIFYRGARVLNASITALLAPGGVGAGMPSLAAAPRLLLSGSSAGGLTTYLHADAIAAAVRAVNPAVDVRAVPEVGFFIDGASIWAGEHIMTGVFARVAAFQNVTGGAAAHVNAACVAATPAAERWRCFMAQYTLPFMQTPTFIVNSMVDEWQTQNVLAPNTVTEPAVTTYAPFAPCIKNPTAGCNATQAKQWTGYADQFLQALAAARAATPQPLAARHGGFITSCPIHTTIISGLSHRIAIRGVTIYDAIVSWMEGKDQDVFTIDARYPGNPTCPKPGEVGDAELRQ